MKFGVFLAVLSMASLFSSCEKDDFVYDPEHSDDPFYGTPLEEAPLDVVEIPVPCVYEVNHLSNTSSGQPLDLIISNYHTPSFYQEANWAIRGSSGPSEKVFVNFLQKPVAGKYLTVSPNGQYISEEQCIVSGNFWVNSALLPFKANAGDTVYVSDLGQGKLSISFCNVRYTYIQPGGTSIDHEFDSGSGNLSSQ